MRPPVLLLTIAGIYTQAVSQTIYTALQNSPTELETVWRFGYEDGQNNSDYKRAYGFATRSLLGDVPVVEGVPVLSTVTLIHPRLVAYIDGFRAAKDGLKGKQLEESEMKVMSPLLTHPKFIGFKGVLRIPPLFQGGHIKGDIDENSFDDVTVEMEIGNKTYQPVKQPGKLDARLIHKEYTYVIDIPTFYGFTAYGMTRWDGFLYPNMLPYATKRVPEAQEYYKADFNAIFDLYNPDGTPRIHTNNNTLTITASYAGRRISAQFNLNEWIDAYTKR